MPTTAALFMTLDCGLADDGFALNLEVHPAVQARPPELFCFLVIVPERFVDALGLVFLPAVRATIPTIHQESHLSPYIYQLDTSQIFTSFPLKNVPYDTANIH